MSEPEKKPRVLDHCVDEDAIRLASCNKFQAIIVIASVLKAPILDGGSK